jgi:ketosteroid isomerase-like protein
MSADPAGAIVDRLFDALARGDVAAALACCTPQARIWHSFDRIAQDRDAAKAGWEAFIAGFPERAFTDVRRSAIPGGFVQQHTMAVKTAAGARIAWPVCLVVEVEGGLIARIEEYMDRAGRYPAGDAAQA